MHKDKYNGSCRRILTQMKWQNQVMQLKGAVHVEHEMETDGILPSYKKRAKIETKGEEKF